MLTTHVCDDCGKTADEVGVLVAMMPGRDGKEWFLCARDYAEGCKPFKLGRFKVTVIEDEKLGEALSAASKRTAGLIEHPPGTAATPSPKPRKKRS